LGTLSRIKLISTAGAAQTKANEGSRIVRGKGAAGREMKEKGINRPLRTSFGIGTDCSRYPITEAYSDQIATKQTKTKKIATKTAKSFYINGLPTNYNKIRINNEGEERFY